MVRRTLDDLLGRTKSQQKEPVAPAAVPAAPAPAPEEPADTGDSPKLTEAQAAETAQEEFYRPIKRQITVRIDADVLAWLKSQGKGYQSRMNAILREAMLNAKAATPGKPRGGGRS
ncbi:BrnA antitoxin family protein [uncultured Jannaschia sp.]|uniref:BrnA antitoxin family protein n=1 Tax=uncultured Jannaschia sp. TaxID=293347 RepID=UPI0026199D99|nr:BrnA antitoxin family protein [uncultured Jannaschia sp.]